MVIRVQEKRCVCLFRLMECQHSVHIYIHHGITIKDKEIFSQLVTQQTQCTGSAQRLCFMEIIYMHPET